MNHAAHAAPFHPEAPEGANPGRATRLRVATMPQHQDAEARSFMTRLMAGELSIAAYTAYLAQYARVYEALESRVPAPGDPAILGDTSLARMESIEADLRALGAADWRETHPALPATRAYVDHLTAINRADVPRYLAHHYTRYLGDLSGGQAIATLVARHYGATEGQLSFYRFENIDSPVRFKRAYREAIDAVAFTDEQEEDLIVEAQVAFGLNSAIFDALEEYLVASAA